MINYPILKNIVLPKNFIFLKTQPPFNLKYELNFMQKYRINLLISKNSGGGTLNNKLIAAQKLRIKVLMIKQPHSHNKKKFFTINSIESYISNKLR